MGNRLVDFFRKNLCDKSIQPIILYHLKRDMKETKVPPVHLVANSGNTHTYIHTYGVEIGFGDYTDLLWWM